MEATTLCHRPCWSSLSSLSSWAPQLFAPAANDRPLTRSLFDTASNSFSPPSFMQVAWRSSILNLPFSCSQQQHLLLRAYARTAPHLDHTGILQDGCHGFSLQIHPQTRGLRSSVRRSPSHSCLDCRGQGSQPSLTIKPKEYKNNKKCNNTKIQNSKLQHFK